MCLSCGYVDNTEDLSLGSGSRYSGFLPQSKYMHVRLICDFELAMDVRYIKCF